MTNPEEEFDGFPEFSLRDETPSFAEIKGKVRALEPLLIIKYSNDVDRELRDPNGEHYDPSFDPVDFPVREIAEECTASFITDMENKVLSILGTERDQLSSIIDPLSVIVQGIDEGRFSSSIVNVTITVRDWEGDDSDAFRVNFLDPFKEAMTNHVTMASILVNAAEAEAAMMHLVRQYLVKLFGLAYQALETEAEVGEDLEFVVGIAADVVPTNLVKKVTSGVGSMAQLVIEGAGTKHTTVVGSETADEVLEGLHSALDAVIEEITAEREEVAQHIRNGFEKFHDDIRSGNISERRYIIPDISGSFGYESDLDYAKGPQ